MAGAAVAPAKRSGGFVRDNGLTIALAVAVAASLGISPATYRRRLAAAVQRIKTALWEEELRS